MKNSVSIGLFGLGTVGSGVIQLIQNHQEELFHQVGCDVKVKTVLVRDIEKDRDVQIADIELTTDPDKILQDPEIDIIIEVMGGEWKKPVNILPTL